MRGKEEKKGGEEDRRRERGVENGFFTLTVQSSELETKTLPPADRAQQVTLSLCPLKCPSTVPVEDSHSCGIITIKL